VSVECCVDHKHSSGRSFAALENGEMNEKQSQNSARTVGWNRLETSAALFLHNCHLKRGVHLNDIHKFIVCLTVKELPQIANENGFNFVSGNYRRFFLREWYEMRTKFVHIL
jgi:hypothetical protein